MNTRHNPKYLDKLIFKAECRNSEKQIKKQKNKIIRENKTQPIVVHMPLTSPKGYVTRENIKNTKQNMWNYIK